MSSGDDFFASLILGLIFIGGPIAVCIDVNRENRENQQRKNGWQERRDTFRTQRNIERTNFYSYTSFNNDTDAEFILDEKHRTVWASDSTGQYVEIPFKEIVGCETIIDNQSVGGIGRAIAGGILAGGAGAIVGALTTHKKIASFKFVIYRNNLQKPSYYYELIHSISNNQTENNINYEKAMRFSQNVTASIKAIIAQNESKSKSEIEKENKQNNEINLEKRLKSLDNLLKKGLISDKEYNEKRSQLLNDL
ncbi:MAG: hypothetical protein IKR92_00015 [Alphaproteobacteria bacterium]|nr:hypothetical protein [Alphaproteobacteria bacterium]